MIFYLRSQAPALLVNDRRRFIDDDRIAGDVTGGVTVDVAAADAVKRTRVTGSKVHRVDALEENEAELEAGCLRCWVGLVVGDGLGIPGLFLEDGLQQVADANNLFFELDILPPQADRIL